MKKFIYAIYDEKAEVYDPVVVFKTNGEAMRTVADAVNDGRSQLSKYPSDFKLYQLATLDDCSGVITGYPVPQFVCNLSELIEKNELEGQLSLLTEEDVNGSETQL